MPLITLGALLFLFIAAALQIPFELTAVSFAMTRLFATATSAVILFLVIFLKDGFHWIIKLLYL